MAAKCPKCQTDNPDEMKFCGECGSPLTLSKEIPVTRTLETPTEELVRGSLFAGRYEIVEELGRGGMGKVYRVFDRKLEGDVALKLIRPEIAKDKKTVERFRNELKLARDITHKNVCRMYDLNEEKGALFITMEYISGGDLKRFIKRARQLTVGTALSIAKQICEGLSEAHSLGVIHRDLKPNNIMIDDNGNAKIMDFGIARSLKTKGITGSGIMIGTPEYMSPEQVEGKKVDQRSDIYSLGIILYEIVTGKVPFEGDTPFSIGMKHTGEIPDDPKLLNAQIPEEFNQLILKCLAKDREERYQSTEELLSELTTLEKSIPTPEKAVPSTTSITSKEITVSINLKKLITPAIIAAALVVVVVAIWQLFLQKGTGPPVKRKPSVAVLPFEDLSPQKDQDYLCYGFAESIINALSQIKDLRIPAPNSSFSFKGKEHNLHEIGEKLDVRAVLRGSVQKAGDKVRITAQLISIEDESIIWSQPYDREINDLFAIQDEISLEIVDRLKVNLLGGEKESLIKRHTENLEAYELFLQGRFFWNKRTVDGFNMAMEYFEKAIDKDPEYALAHVGIADTYSMLNGYYQLSAEEAFPRAKEEALKALAFDDKLAEAHTSLAWIKMCYDWDWEGADKEFKLALEINPNYIYAHSWYGYYFIFFGQFDKARVEMERAYELDPLNIAINRSLGVLFTFSQDYEKAERALQKTVMMDPNYTSTYISLGELYLHQSRYDEALDMFQKALYLRGGNDPLIRSWIGVCYANMGKREEAKEVLNDLMELSNQRYINPTFIGHIYGELGQMDDTFKWIDRAYEERDFNLLFMKVTPFDNVRSNPRYESMLKKMGLDK